MKKSLLFAILIAIVCNFSGCFYVGVTAPLDTDLDKTTLGSKTGKSTAQSIMWLVAWGDAGTKAAAENGNITVINHMDTQIFSVFFGIYSKNTTIVYGD
jgi:hypothetical protein